LQARQVLRWKNDKPVLAEKVWDTLAGANTEIFDTLEEMNNQYRVSSVVCGYQSVGLSLLCCTDRYHSQRSYADAWFDLD
jgi:hypothetical protein